MVPKCVHGEADVRRGEDDEVEVAEEEQDFGGYGAEAEAEVLISVLVFYSRDGKGEELDLRFTHVFVPCHVGGVWQRYGPDDDGHVCRGPSGALIVRICILVDFLDIDKDGCAEA